MPTLDPAMICLSLLRRKTTSNTEVKKKWSFNGHCCFLNANVYQSNFANGIYALGFQQDGSNCEYDTNDSGIVEGNCKISIVNHSSDAVTFRVSIDQKYNHNRFNVTDLINLKDHQSGFT